MPSFTTSLLSTQPDVNQTTSLTTIVDQTTGSETSLEPVLVTGYYKMRFGYPASGIAFDVVGFFL